MQYLQYNDPLMIIWRKGTIDDPYVDKIDTQKIINGQIVLSEIPDEFSHVKIDGYTEVYDTAPASNQFVVDYQTGIITFNPSEEGKTVTATYKGRGIIMYPAERIYVHSDDPNMVQNIQEMIDNGQQAIQAYTDIGNAINTANTVKTQLENDISTANTLHTNLTNDINTGNTLHANLTNDINTGNSLHTTLTNDINTGNTLHTTLTNDINSGNSLHTTLTNDINTGNTLHTTLTNDISTGNSLHTTLTNDINTGNVLHTTLETDMNNANTAKTNLENVITVANSTINTLNSKILNLPPPTTSTITKDSQGRVINVTEIRTDLNITVNTIDYSNFNANNMPQQIDEKEYDEFTKGIYFLRHTITYDTDNITLLSDNTQLIPYDSSSFSITRNGLAINPLSVLNSTSLNTFNSNTIVSFSYSTQNRLVNDISLIEIHGSNIYKTYKTGTVTTVPN